MENQEENNISGDAKSKVLCIHEKCKVISKYILESNSFNKEDKYNMMTICCAAFISTIGRELFPVFTKRDVKNILEDVSNIFESNE